MNERIWNGKNNTICLTYCICCTLSVGHYQMFDGIITFCTAQHTYDGTSCPIREGSCVNNTDLAYKDILVLPVLSLCQHDQKLQIEMAGFTVW